MIDPVQERQDAYLDEIDAQTLEFNEGAIRDYLADVPEIILERIAQVNGTYAAQLIYQPHRSYMKGFGTPWYKSLEDLRQSVMDTFAHVKGLGELDVNIFSAEMFEYLSAEMLGDKSISMTIKNVVEQEIAGPRGKDIKVTISFNERPKKLILNKTNARAIAKSLGPETDNWRGATVTLGVENVKVGPNTIPSVRVKSASAVKRNGVPPGTPDQPSLVTADPTQGPGAYTE